MIYFLRSLFTTSLVMTVLLGCADKDNNNFPENDSYLSISITTVMLTPDEGSLNLLTQNFDINSIAYEDTQYFGESYSYDIFNQVAGLLRNPQVIDALNGISVEYLLALGESHSANT